jgi:hypothetical protein
MRFLIVGMVTARTINLSRLADEFPSEAKIESINRRLQRFFQNVDLSLGWAAPLSVKMIEPGPSWH